MTRQEQLKAFVPMTLEEIKARNWDSIDILLISGDAYADHQTFGPSIIARVLLNAGYRVAICAQPDWKNPESLKQFGRPEIACAITSGNMDSMVKLYTAGRRLRREDMYAPGGKPGLCPPHATVVYSQLARQAFPGIPVVIGGVEASMRRVSHYDYWQDKMRPSVIVDSKADILCYGMGERSILNIFRKLKNGESLSGIRGTCRYLGGNESKAFSVDDDCIVLPSHEEICSDRHAIMTLTKIVEREMNPWNGKRLLQWTNGRLLVVEPPEYPMTTEEYDKICELPFTGLQHWSYQETIPAWDIVKCSLPAVRGCPGGCAFCGIMVHHGHHLISRSTESLLRSVEKLMKQPFFKGIITDIGGAAGNIFQHGPKNPELCKKCKRVSCLFPDFCKNYKADEIPLLKLLSRLDNTEGIRKVVLNSGIRLDLALVQRKLTEKIIQDHTPGHISIAPEHLDPEVLRLMRKGKADELEKFREIFDHVNRKTGKKQFMDPYFISNFPGCTRKQMKTVDDFLVKNHWDPKQVQDYIPLPMTMGCAMYCAGIDPDGNPIEVNRGLAERRDQRNMLRRKHTQKPGKKFKNGFKGS